MEGRRVGRDVQAEITIHGTRAAWILISMSRSRESPLTRPTREVPDAPRKTICAVMERRKSTLIPNEYLIGSEASRHQRHLQLLELVESLYVGFRGLEVSEGALPLHFDASNLHGGPPRRQRYVIQRCPAADR